MNSVSYGNILRFPLRVQPNRMWTDAEFGKLSPATVMMTTLDFRKCWLGPKLTGWECMACREAGNKWIGDDPDSHWQAHQMGFDFAIMWLKKHEKEMKETK